MDVREPMKPKTSFFRSRVWKAGNSLVVTIPSNVLSTLDIYESELIEVWVKKDE